MAAAMPLLARQGPSELSLDEVAVRAGVTRNLLYHYFPQGRADLVTAAIQEAEDQLLGGRDPAALSTSRESLQDTLSRVLDHALAPTHAWRVHRLARAGGPPAARELIEASTRAVAQTLAGLYRSAGASSPLAAVALHGYVAFAEDVLDGARAVRMPRAEVMELLAGALQAIVGVT